MPAFEYDKKLANYLLDESRKIPKSHLHSVCQFKCGHRTCRYISLSLIGYVCVKKTPIKQMLDNMNKEEKLSAQSDNCEGLGKLKNLD